MRVLDTAQMREADRRTIDEIGIPSIVLMENAGRRVAEVIASTFDDLADCRVAVLCGRGSNGGDGFVVARALHQRGTEVAVFLLGAAADVDGDARTTSMCSAVWASRSWRCRTLVRGQGMGRRWRRAI